MFRWLKRKKSKPKAVAFVDYEYWFYSYKTRFGIVPNPATWQAELKDKYDLVDIMFFADFSMQGLGGELNKIREITNTIIETSDDFQRTKDMTDFVMLDYIYRWADERKKIKRFIIFTGDGHFQSVINYLIHKKKEVTIYAVEGTVSQRLLHTSAEQNLLPAKKELLDKYARLVIKDLADCSLDDKVIPTINSTAETVARRYKISTDHVKAAIIRMLDEGYIYQKYKYVDFNRKVKVIVPQWEVLIANGIWDPTNDKVIESSTY